MSTKKVQVKPASKKLFRDDQCRHRGADGRPDCTSKKIRPAAATCQKHAAEWMAAHGRAPKARKSPAPRMPKASKAEVVRLSARRPAPRPKAPVARVAALVAVEPTVEKVR